MIVNYNRLFVMTRCWRRLIHADEKARVVAFSVIGPLVRNILTVLLLTSTFLARIGFSVIWIAWAGGYRQTQSVIFPAFDC